MPNYENETCEGCHYLNDGRAGCYKSSKRRYEGKNKDEPDLRWNGYMRAALGSGPACKDFSPTLACRQVRALEKLVKKADFLVDHGLAKASLM